MSNHKLTDTLCIIIVILALVITILFMNGEALGITVMLSDDEQADVELFSDRDTDPLWDEDSADTILLSDEGCTISGTGGYVLDDTVVIASAGTYIVSGTLSDGQIIIDTSETASAAKVQLVLNGVNISCSDSAAILVEEADKVFLTLADGTENSVSSGDVFSEDAVAGDITAAIFSRDDLTVNGSGTLNVTCGWKHGIVSKDDLVITGGTLNVTAASDGIRGKDSVRISGGTFTVTSGSDGIQASEAADLEKGYVYISGGTFEIDAARDGIQAETDLTIEGGTFVITTGGGSENTLESESVCVGGVTLEPASGTTAKGLKAEGKLLITGGTFTINAADDAIHTNGDLTIEAGTLTLSSGDDGIHADSSLEIQGGTIAVQESCEGIEAPKIDITDGDIFIYATDDGLNANGEESDPGAESDAAGGGDSGEASINISGGFLYVDSGGDGIDSNGSITMDGGVVLVCSFISGTNANGAMDMGSGAEITGGTLITALDYAGMNDGSYSDASQNCLSVSLDDSVAAGATILIADSGGQVLATFRLTESWYTLVFSSSELTEGSEYSLYVVNDGGSSYDFRQGGTLTGDLLATAAAEPLSSLSGTMQMGDGMQAQGGTAPQGGAPQR